jgi:hypothetical protein
LLRAEPDCVSQVGNLVEGIPQSMSSCDTIEWCFAVTSCSMRVAAPRGWGCAKECAVECTIRARSQLRELVTIEKDHDSYFDIDQF